MEETTYEPVTVGNWMLTTLLMCIPFVNIILLFVWAFGSNTPISKANWAKAALLWAVISAAVYVLLFVVWAAVGVTAAVVAPGT